MCPATLFEGDHRSGSRSSATHHTKMLRANSLSPRVKAHMGPPAAYAGSPRATWTRPVPDRDADFVKPARVPSQPVWQPSRREEDRPLYSPPPEFRPSELPDKAKEMPAGPRMPERRPDPIPAGNPKEKPGEGQPDKREAPPAPNKEGAPAPKK